MKSILCNASSGYGVARRAGKLLAALIFTLAAGISVASARTLTLTALGDSLTAGYGLEQGQGLVPQLQAWLTARGHDVRVLNAGVSGDTTTGGLQRLDWVLADRPDAMIVALGGNDLLRGIDPALSRANLGSILGRLDDAGIPALLVGLPAPANYGPAFQQAFAALYPDLARAHDALLLPDLLAPIAAARDAGTPATDLMQGDMIHPNAAGVALIVDALGPQVEALLTRVSP
ncbi:MAG: arylesterase [Rhodobacter sp.]|nr:arylesterase [Paracoccaceae bacterium]MCC0080429.1 arylesterase [Rhodobacter sp.]